jgi:hypothetical protein
VVAEGALAYVVKRRHPESRSVPRSKSGRAAPDADVSPDGTRMAMGLADGRGRVMDVESRVCLLDLQVAKPDDRRLWSYVNAGLSGDGRTVAFATYLLPPANRTEIHFYDVATGKSFETGVQLEAAVNRFGPSPDGGTSSPRPGWLRPRVGSPGEPG